MHAIIRLPQPTLCNAVAVVYFLAYFGYARRVQTVGTQSLEGRYDKGINPEEVVKLRLSLDSAVEGLELRDSFREDGSFEVLKKLPSLLLMSYNPVVIPNFVVWETSSGRGVAPSRRLTQVGMMEREAETIPEELLGLVRVPTGSTAPAQHIRLISLLSTCIHAVQKGMKEIRRVHATRADAGAELQADYKIFGDPRSAVTAADLASQLAIEKPLATAWPGLRIVGEEDLGCDLSHAANGTICSSAVSNDNAKHNPLRRDLCSALPADAIEIFAALDDITVFVDPLDGTREFVEGRVQNVQTLVGIAVRGNAIAGAVGLPFGSGSSGIASLEVVYALVGASTGLHGSRARAKRLKDDEKQLLLLAGDTNDPVLMAAYNAALANGGRKELLGGTGQKMLAVTEGRADMAIMNFKSNYWDTCAPEALIRAAGGEVTDIFGERIVHRPDPPAPATYLNRCGVIVSAAPFAETHQDVCSAMRKNLDALQKLIDWGLTFSTDGKADASEVERVLRERREKMLHDA